ncbi:MULTISPECIES: hypothetical protein [Brevibacillus]|uniref:hypothetical protein n=1 Tax=Brevibacillus TaxID=55080 RepID=UPI00160582B1|nr:MULTISPECIES: hypothetical protein [Brevibacillus]MCM3081357.1 hypothetical protein [Brevibacillus invocatus]MCM3431655.1 hypothetical protein [Brevibacillus invocatus]MDH4617949.1 hypothetical protein [Brevibacillus sp. AY1]
MLYILGIVVAVIGAGYFLTGLLSFKARDKHSVQHYSDDAYYQQTMNHMSQNNHNPF